MKVTGEAFSFHHKRKRAEGARYQKYLNFQAKGIKMVPTNLVGGGKNNNCDKFEIEEKEHLVKKCPSGHKPITTKFKEGYYRAHLGKNTVTTVSSGKVVRSQNRKKVNSLEYQRRPYTAVSLSLECEPPSIKS